MVRRVRDQSSATSSQVLPIQTIGSKDEAATPRSTLASVESRSQTPAANANDHSVQDDPNAPSRPKRKSAIIFADLLIPGQGDPIKDACLTITDDIITYVGPSSSLSSSILSSASGSYKKYHVPVLMPGLWDCHIHFMGAPNDADHTAWFSTHPVACGARLARGCWELIQAGYTSVRDCGGYGNEVFQAVEDGVVVGPNIYSAGAALSQLAGHGDIFGIPAGDVLANFGVGATAGSSGVVYGAGICCIADGVEEVRRGVRLQLRRGAKVIKVLASGGVLSRDDNPRYQQFSDEELKVVVEETERQGRIVAAHVHGKAGIMAAIRAGCKTLEHVSYADDEVLEEMKKKDLLYIATRNIIEVALATNGKNIPAPSWKKLQAIEEAHMDAYKLAVKSGVKIALGTDGATNPGEPGSFGKQAKELEWAVKAGMTNAEAITAATATGPLSVGAAMAPKTGQLKKGYVADVIALTENPLDDVRVLQDTANVTHVWKGGKLFKGPGVGPWGEE